MKFRSGASLAKHQRLSPQHGITDAGQQRLSVAGNDRDFIQEAIVRGDKSNDFVERPGRWVVLKFLNYGKGHNTQSQKQWRNQRRQTTITGRRIG